MVWCICGTPNNSGVLLRGIIEVLGVLGHYLDVKQRFLPVLCTKSAGRVVQLGAKILSLDALLAAS
jgi:hypothetical protein